MNLPRGHVSKQKFPFSNDDIICVNVWAEIKFYLMYFKFIPTPTIYILFSLKKEVLRKNKLSVGSARHHF